MLLYGLPVLMGFGFGSTRQVEALLLRQKDQAALDGAGNGWA